MRAIPHRFNDQKAGGTGLRDDSSPSPLSPTAALAARILGFALLCYLLASPQVSPLVAGTDIRLIPFHAALLNLAFMLRPKSELPWYAVIYAAVVLACQSGAVSPFDFARTVIEVGQTLVFSLIVRHYFPMSRTVGRPEGVLGYAFSGLGICAVGGALVLAAAVMVDMSADLVRRELAGDPALIWRHWWLGYTCSYIAIASSIRLIILRGSKLPEDVPDDPKERRTFVLMTLALLAISVIMFPSHDITPLDLPPDVRIAMTVVPAPFGFALAARFRGMGAAFAILILTPLALFSVTGPHAFANWSDLPPMATPMHVFLIMTSLTCWTLAAISRQRGWAIAEAAEARNAKARFVAQMNHELRTPLNAILGFSELIRMQNLREMRHALGPIQNIHASGQRLLAMIEGLLSQADRGTAVFELEKQPVHLATAIGDAVDELKDQYEEQRFTAEVIADEQLMIEADPRALRQMLHVLLGYALRFAGPGSSVTVRAQEVGSDTVLEVDSTGLINAVADDRDKIEIQLVNALSLAHGARLTVVQRDRGERLSRLTFFATRAA
jgi:signal transduction histidine kinase